MRVLVVRLSALGDVICTLPVAVALKQRYPHAELTWACDPRFAGILECCASVDRIVRIKPGIRPGSWKADPRPFDVALDMQGLLKSALVVATSRAKTKLGYHWQREGSWLFSQKVLPDPTSLHIVDQYVDVARAAGAGVEQADFGLVPLAEDVEKLGHWRRQKGIGDAYVVLNAGAGWTTKRWTAEGYAAVARWLVARDTAPIFIGGKSASDQAAFDEVRTACDNLRIHSALGQTSVRELVALLAGARAHVGGDTGSTHLAAALSIPAIGLYSLTRPERSCPYGQFHRAVYDPKGLSFIPADAVIERLATIV
jgi:lipopolysaccharide heptosyltransferase I